MSYPNRNIDEALAADFVENTVSSLMELSNKGIPQSTEELKQRIQDYFLFCGEKDMRPGVETLSLALSVSRQTFWNWTQGTYRDAEWQQTCQQAKQIILSFLECASLQGKLNPATSIFLLKNWGSYRDAVELETSVAQSKESISAGELPKLSEGEG